MARRKPANASRAAMTTAADSIAATAAGALPIEAYTHVAPPPDPVSTIGTWPAEAVTIRRRDDNQAMLFRHIIDWLRANPDAEIGSVLVGRWERGREITFYVWRRA